jgi:hypothetical protein
LDPIEQVFAEFKALLRKAAARTLDTLWRAICNLFAPHACWNFLNNCAGFHYTIRDERCLDGKCC